ncbi:MAG: FAD-dependent oxidoreductase [Gemmatimonadota bacterium]|jgi:isorenieratene synthase|nr:MAG: FAD-dependent oxidoreductase [Gemmatimonadota bacterium]
MRSRGVEQICLPLAQGRERVEGERSAVVVGGGIGGIAAATVLAERGVQVTLLEREAYLGGRAGAWTDRLSNGEPFEMERGFHAFFRQYYNLRALLRRVDPELELLVPLEDYPILGPGGEEQSFRDLPVRTPFNVIALTARSPALGLRDLARVNARRALEMVAYDQDRTYDRHDHASAERYLDSLGFPPRARSLLFDVFAHSFFNPEGAMSAGELLMMFHFYFTGNPEGLVFDVAARPFSTAIWDPFARYLEGSGVSIRTGETARRIRREGKGRWRVETDGPTFAADGLVLALTVPALQDLVAQSPDLADEGWRAAVRGLELTNPFAVWRLWLDRPTRPGRAPFVGTTGLGPIDNISLYHLFEDESREWYERHGGAVVELHAYAIEYDQDDAELRDQLLGALHGLYPETRDARVLEERYLIRQDCPAFSPGSHSDRPTVQTPFRGLALAGDFLKLPIPSALMERAAASGFLAANHLLAADGVRSEPLRSVPRRGLLSSLPLRRLMERKAD